MSTHGHADTTQPWLACPECHAPLETTQRYCVSCGARHAEADNPAARYFGAVARHRRAPLARPARRGVGIGVALVLAVLPLAVGVGVLVGHSGHGDASLLSALRDQKPTVVNVGAGTGASDGGGSAGATAGTSASAAAQAAGESNAVVATGVGGVAHSVLHHTQTARSRAVDKQVVRNLTKQKGRSYVQSQRSLPDVIDVQSDPGAGGGTAPQGPGD